MPSSKEPLTIIILALPERNPYILKETLESCNVPQFTFEHMPGHLSKSPNDVMVTGNCFVSLSTQPSPAGRSANLTIAV